MKLTDTPHGRPFWFITGVMILAAGIVGFTLLKSHRSYPVMQAGTETAPLVRVTALQSQTGPVVITGNGIVRPRAEISLSPQVAGEIKYINPVFVSGGEFREGDVLLRLDQRRFRHALAQTQAERKTTLATLAFTEKQIERLKGLVKKGSVAEEEYDRQLSQRQELLGTLERQEANIAQAELELEYTTITAPFTGRVRTEQTDIGAYVKAGDELGRIFTTDTAEITIQLGDNEAALIAGLWDQDFSGTGQRPRAMVFTEYGNRGYSWEGYVHRTEAAIDADTRTVNVVIRVPNPTQTGQMLATKSSAGRLIAAAPPLTVGMYVTAHIMGMEPGEYFSLPRAAVRDGNKIWVVSDDGILSILEVTVIQEADNIANVMGSELKPGMKVITSNLPVVAEGMKVRIVDQEELTAS